jgi:hypothetical protein
VKALIILIAALLVLRHPVGVAVVLAVETAVCGGLGWLVWRGLNSLVQPLAWRRAA